MMYRAETTQPVKYRRKSNGRHRIVVLLLLSVVVAAAVVVLILSDNHGTQEADDAANRQHITTLRNEARHSLEHYVVSNDVPLSSRKYYKIFNDNNDIQLAAARLNGIDHPFNKRDDFVNLPQLMHIQPCALYDINKLTHSLPYLVPSARVLLDDIGLLFRSKVGDKYPGADYRIIVTSLLRTEEDIRRLRRRNRNATAKSCHRYGTTFDIAYARFDKVGEQSVNDGILKHILAETLYELRQQGRCFVIYERRQRCFHITVRSTGHRFNSVADCIDIIRHYAMAESGNGLFSATEHADVVTVQTPLSATTPTNFPAKDYTVIHNNVADSSHIPFL